MTAMQELRHLLPRQDRELLATRNSSHLRKTIAEKHPEYDESTVTRVVRSVIDYLKRGYSKAKAIRQGIRDHERGYDDDEQGGNPYQYL